MSRFHPLLAAALALAAVGCTQRAPATEASGPGLARVLVTCGTSGACASITRVAVTVSKGDGPDFPEIHADLDRSGDQWSGRIQDVPAGPGRHFAVAALDKDAKVLYTGEGKSDIAPGAAAVVSIFLNGTSPPGPVASFPVIDSLTLSRTQVAPGHTVQVSVTAHDPGGGAVTFFWRASCGVYADPTQAAGLWTAPTAEGPCQLSITVAAGNGAAVTASASVSVTGQVGDVTISAQLNDSPIISGLTGRVTLGAVLEGDLTATAADPDGDPLSYEWTSDCAGLTFDLDIPYGKATPHLRLPGPSSACKVSLAVTDGARGGRTTASIMLPPNRTLDSRCNGITCPSGQTCDPADGTCKAPANPCAGVTCTASDLCHEPGACDPASGQCTVGAPKTCPAGATCDLADGICKSTGGLCANVTCTASDKCHDPGVCDPATGQCSAGAARTCPAGQSCDLADGICKGAPGGVLLPRPQVARHYEVPNFQGVAMATDGSAYVTGTLALPTKTFDAFPLTSAGAGDAFVARYGPDGVAVWARNFGDSADQQPTGIAVAGDGTVVTIGQFNGNLTATLANTRNTPIDYLLGLNASDGSVKFARGFNNGVSGVLLAVAANPARNLVAVCGFANQAATDLVPGATYGGGNQDIVIAAFDSAGTPLWSRQIGGANEEECDALAVDDAGDVLAAGKYDGTLTITGAPLPSPASSFRRWLWLAKFAGATGTPVSQASFGSGAGNHRVQAMDVDATGKVVVSGYMTNTLTFGGSALTTAGSTDAFVAKLDPAAATPFAHVWSTRLGGTGPDEARGVAVDSAGDVTVVGLFNGTTTGAAGLTAVIPTASSAFVLKLDGATGLTQYPAPGGSVTGDAASTVNANKVAVNRLGVAAAKDLVTFGGEFQGTITFGPPTSPLVATNAENFLVFAKLLP